MTAALWAGHPCKVTPTGLRGPAGENCFGRPPFLFMLLAMATTTAAAAAASVLCSICAGRLRDLSSRRSSTLLLARTQDALGGRQPRQLPSCCALALLNAHATILCVSNLGMRMSAMCWPPRSTAAKHSLPWRCFFFLFFSFLGPFKREHAKKTARCTPGEGKR